MSNKIGRPSVLADREYAEIEFAIEEGHLFAHLTILLHVLQSSNNGEKRSKIEGMLKQIYERNRYVHEVCDRSSDPVSFLANRSGTDREFCRKNSETRIACPIPNPVPYHQFFDAELAVDF